MTGDGGSFEDNTDFVNLDQGSPPEMSDEEEDSDESGESDDSDQEADEVLDIVA